MIDKTEITTVEDVCNYASGLTIVNMSVNRHHGGSDVIIELSDGRTLGIICESPVIIGITRFKDETLQ